MTFSGTLLSIQVGQVQRLVMPEAARIDARDAMWSSGIFKQAARGPVRVRTAGLEGDQQADLENHGGPDNVVLAYDAAHYTEWRSRLARTDLEHGAFGENFTVMGFSDETVCIGDIWQVGDPEVAEGVRLQVTQARQPCYKLARRLREPDIVRMVRENSWGGWYLRVLREGTVEAGMPITLVERLHSDWPVAVAVQVMYTRRKDPAGAATLATLPELSARWKRELLE